MTVTSGDEKRWREIEDAYAARLQQLETEENTRKMSELLRDQAESRREYNEKLRQASELMRDHEERVRNGMEKLRREFELKRQANEELRATADRVRIDLEATRKKVAEDKQKRALERQQRQGSD